jgi:hypothetical protein
MDQLLKRVKSVVKHKTLNYAYIVIRFTVTTKDLFCIFTLTELKINILRMLRFCKCVHYQRYMMYSEC